MQKYVIISAYPVTLSEKSFTALGKKKKIIFISVQLINFRSLWEIRVLFKKMYTLI